MDQEQFLNIRKLKNCILHKGKIELKCKKIQNHNKSIQGKSIHESGETLASLELM